jgi:ribosome maturation factor RimP
MRDAAVAEKAREVVQPAIEAAGYELVDVAWKHEQGGWVLRVYVDKQPGGITHEDCERVSREISTVLDVHDFITHAYSLEVSSPGLERPLRTVEHFRRFIGKKAKIKLKQGVAGRRNYSGTIVAADADARTVTVEVDGVEHVLPLGDLDRANLQLDMQALLGKREGR